MKYGIFNNKVIKNNIVVRIIIMCDDFRGIRLMGIMECIKSKVEGM